MHGLNISTNFHKNISKRSEVNSVTISQTNPDTIITSQDKFSAGEISITVIWACYYLYQCSDFSIYHLPSVKTKQAPNCVLRHQYVGVVRLHTNVTTRRKASLGD